MGSRTASSESDSGSLRWKGERTFRQSRLRSGVCLLPLLSLLWIGCGDDDDPPTDPGGDPDPVELPDLVAEEVATFQVVDLEVRVDRDGQLTEGKRIDNEAYAIFISSLWIGGMVAGEPHANIAWDGGSPWSNFSSLVDGEPIGPYIVTSDHLANEEIEWPIAHGYPTNDDGEPVVYGDSMVWSALRTATDRQLNDATASPLPGLEIGMSVFGVADEDLDDVLFLRYDIHNGSDQIWDDVYVGLYSDSDLSFIGPPGGNRTMYIGDQGITVTYAGTLPMNQPQWMSAFAFLTTPTEDAPQHRVTSHRLMVKNAEDLYGETNFTTPEQVLWAMQGLTNLGSPMIDPSTGEGTLFAVDGDPSSGTGWIDNPPRDVRGLMSSGPFTIEADGTETVFAIWLLAEGDDFAGARAAVIGSVIRARREAYRLVVGRTE